MIQYTKLFIVITTAIIVFSLSILAIKTEQQNILDKCKVDGGVKIIHAGKFVYLCVDKEGRIK